MGLRGKVCPSMGEQVGVPTCMPPRRREFAMHALWDQQSLRRTSNDKQVTNRLHGIGHKLQLATCSRCTLSDLPPFAQGENPERTQMDMLDW